MVTGGGSGIGRAVCLQAARKGARVVVVNRTADKGEEVAHEITGEGFEAIKVTLNLAEGDTVAEGSAPSVNSAGYGIMPTLGVSDLSFLNIGKVKRLNSERSVAFFDEQGERSGKYCFIAYKHYNTISDKLVRMGIISTE